MRVETTFLSQLQRLGQEEKDNMANPIEDMTDQGKTAVSKIDFIRLAGIGPELAEFVTEFIDRPEFFFSMSFEKRREFENQMDAILSSFGP